MRTKAILGDKKLIDHHCDIGDMGGNSVRVRPSNFMAGGRVYQTPVATWLVCRFGLTSASAALCIFVVCRKLYGDVSFHRYSLVKMCLLKII